MRLRAQIPIAVCLLFLSPAAYAQLVDVKRYVSIRKSLATAAPSHKSSLVEIRGRLSGISGGAAGGSIIVSSPDRGSSIIIVDQLPKESPGFDIACLAVVLDDGGLRAHAWTYDAELKRYEESQKSRPAPTAVRRASGSSPKPAAQKTAASGKAPVLTAEQMVAVYRKWVKEQNPKLAEKQADTIARSILNFSYHYKVDARLVCAVILAESHFRVGATSRAGAQGLGQLMPTTAAGLGVNNAYDPEQNIYGSTRYIKSMLDRVTGNKHWNELSWNDVALALAAYNAGPGAVKKHGGIPPYRETRNYVNKVVQIYRSLCGAG